MENDVCVVEAEIAQWLCGT